jgi:hypothetical protein
MALTEEGVKLKNKSIDRGKNFLANYKDTPREKVIWDMAAYIYEHLEGFNQGMPTFEELSNSEKNLYVVAARFSYKLAMASKGWLPE